MGFSAAAMLGALALSLGPPSSAHAAPADGAPQWNDVVGVGSDTMQYILNFGDDGDPLGDTGFNSAGNFYRVASFDATTDANGRMAFPHDVLLPLDPTVVLRAGTYPIQRPNGGDAGVSALLADTSPTYPLINFATVISAPTAPIPDVQPTNDETAQAVANGWGGLEAFTLGTSTIQIAAATTTNAPVTGLTLSQLQNIYACNSGYRNWDSPALGSGPDATIVPMIPPLGSDLRTAFLDDLGVTDTGGCVVIAQDNDPTTVSDNPNAIEPFAASTLNLWLGLSGNTLGGLAQNGAPYFHDQGDVYPGGPALSPGISLLPGYSLPIDLQVIYRETDQNSTTTWEPGSTLNWAQTLFCDPGSSLTPFFQTFAGKILIAEAGADPLNQSCASFT
jgi:hypothetical protein